MITIFSGVPGSGKTALIVEMIMSELREGRRVFTVGIPELMLNVQPGGDPLTWQDGTWLEIDRYNPALTKAKGISSQWFPRDCSESCPFLSDCNARSGLKPRDAGALLVIDEAHSYFPQRASGKAPPPHVEALNVHRHQGLDIWFVTQRPSFLDPFVRGLASRHIHLGLSAFVFFGQRIKYEWPEYQETLNRFSKMSASKSKYKPSPGVFPLYKSSTIHTKLDHRMPNIMRAFIGVVVVLLGMSGLAYSRINERINPQAVESKPIKQVPSASAVGAGGERSAQTATGAEVPVQPIMPYLPVVDACIANDLSCRCYRGGQRVMLDEATCRRTLIEGAVQDVRGVGSTAVALR